MKDVLKNQTLQLLWAQKREPSRGPKPTLDLRQIVWAAIAVADAEGLEALSMKRVARACGVTTMALYRYVPDKAALLALMIDLGLGEPPASIRTQVGWRSQLEKWARELWKIFCAHPWSLKATAPVRLLGPNELAWFECAIQALSTTGFTSLEMVGTVEGILVYVRGRAVLRTQQAGTDRHWEHIMSELLQKHTERFPGLATAMAAGAFSELPDEDELELGLNLMFDGIATRIAERTRHR